MIVSAILIILATLCLAAIIWTVYHMYHDDKRQTLALQRYQTDRKFRLHVNYFSQFTPVTFKKEKRWPES